MTDNGLGIYLQSLPVDLTVDFARRAEGAGFRSVWLSEIIFGDAIVPATAIALATERIEIATGARTRVPFTAMACSRISRAGSRSKAGASRHPSADARTRGCEGGRHGCRRGR